jgi:hypothetical protein
MTGIRTDRGNGFLNSALMVVINTYNDFNMDVGHKVPSEYRRLEYYTDDDRVLV